MIFIIVGVGLIAVFTYGCCKVAADADRREEQFFKDDQNK